MPWTGIASAGASFLSNALGMFGQKSESKKNRDWQEEMMNKQNEWNLSQWNRENAYNSPKQQMERLEAAGLNPDMVYGQGQIQNVGSVGPRSMQSASPVQADISSYVHGMGNAIRQGLESANIKADTENTEADTRKKTGEAKILESDVKFRDEFNKNGIELQNFSLRQSDKNLVVTDEQIGLLRLSAKNAEQTFNILGEQYRTQVAQTKLLDAQGERQLISNITARAKDSAEIRSLLAKAGLDEKHSSMVVGLMAAQIYNLNESAQLNNELQKQSVEEQNKIHSITHQIQALTEEIKLNVELNSRYGDVERITNIASSLPSAIAKIIGGYTIK